jgi:hypothetical protein
MKETVAEHLGEEYGDAIARQLGDVHPSIAQALDLADGHAVMRCMTMTSGWQKSQ